MTLAPNTEQQQLFSLIESMRAEIEQLRKERDALQKRIDSGVRVEQHRKNHWFYGLSYICNFSSIPNATLILDDVNE